MSKNISDDLSVGYRLKTYFNYYIKNSNSAWTKLQQCKNNLEITMKTLSTWNR